MNLVLHFLQVTQITGARRACVVHVHCAESLERRICREAFRYGFYEALQIVVMQQK